MIFLMVLIFLLMLLGREGFWALFLFAVKAAIVLAGVGFLIMLVVASQHP